MGQTHSSTNLAEVLRKAREDLHLTQEQWATRLGVSARTVSRWEQGESVPRGSAQKVAIALQAAEEDVPTIRNLLQVPGDLPNGSLRSGYGLGSAATNVQALNSLGSPGSPKPPSQPPAQPVVFLETLQEAAQQLGVDWNQFRSSIATALKAARDQGLYLQHVIAQLENKQT